MGLYMYHHLGYTKKQMTGGDGTVIFLFYTEHIHGYKNIVYYLV